jgi:hypothetical protein
MKAYDENYVCSKRKYKKRDAQTMLNSCRKKKRTRRPIRIYECRDCNAWHLTSKKKT